MPWQAPSTSTASLRKSIAALKWMSCQTVPLFALFCCSSSSKSRWGVTVFYKLSFISTQDYTSIHRLLRINMPKKMTLLKCQEDSTNNHYDMILLPPVWKFIPSSFNPHIWSWGALATKTLLERSLTACGLIEPLEKRSWRDSWFTLLMAVNAFRTGQRTSTFPTQWLLGWRKSSGIGGYPFWKNQWH